MTNSKPADVAEATGTDPRLGVIADVLHGLIPGANPLRMQVLVVEDLPDQPGAHNSWVGSAEAVAAKILAGPATARETAERIAALTAHLTTQTIPASDRAAVLRQIAEIQQNLFDVLVALTLAVADEHGSTADDVVAAADEAGCLAGHSRDACETAAQAAQELALTDEEHRRAVADMTLAQWDAHDYLAARQAEQYGDAR